MNIRIMACAWAAVIVVGATSPASAGVWIWGCQGKIGDQQVIYNRYALAVIPAKESPGPLREIMDRVSIVKGGDDPASSYESTGDGGGSFEPIMKFKRHNDPNRTLTLTEKSSRKISGKHRLICGRDEDTDVFRKVYRYQREDEPARDITMQCMEYQLSTRGGRKGCD
jgi:hypothetical protein